MQLAPACFEVINEPVILKELESESFVMIENTRGVRESLDQMYVKEFESTWINEMEKFETLGTERAGEQSKPSVAAPSKRDDAPDKGVAEQPVSEGSRNKEVKEDS